MHCKILWFDDEFEREWNLKYEKKFCNINDES